MPEPSTLDPTTPHAAARRYAALGWRVLPIRPGGKRPPMQAWQDAATVDATIIDAWWTGLYSDHGVGIATGAASGVWVLDVDVADGKAGDETLAELEDTYGPLPPTPEQITGSGGRHLFFAWPTSVDIRNSASGALGPGLDVRGTGGQVVAAPTVHANGQPYSWVDGHEPWTIDVAEAPGWLLTMLTPAPAPTAPPASTQGPIPGEDGPAARFNAATTWADLLTADGWTLHHTDRDGEQHWTRPGKERREGTSATVGYRGNDALTVFTSSVPGLAPETTYSRFGYLAATRHAGDRSACAHALIDAGYGRPDVPVDLSWIPDVDDGEEGEDDLPTGWATIDLGDVLTEGYEPPRPTVLRRTDNAALLYAGRVNAIIGESGSGKSWVSQAAIAQVIQADEDVLVIDLEDHVGSYVHRLLGLGCTRAQLVAHLHYVSPENSFNERAAAEICELVTTRAVALVVIDSTGEAMAIDGAKPNDDDDTARWFRNLPRRLANLGPAVLLLDHIPKADDAPKGFAIGSQRKRAAIDGAMHRVEVGVAPVRGKEGHVRLVCAKDRSGYWQHGAKVADVTIVDTAHGVTVRIGPPTNVERPTVLMERVSRYLEENGETPRRTVEKGVSGKTPSLRKAIDVLVQEEWVDQVPRVGRGGGFNLISIRPYRDDEAVAWVVDNHTPEGSAPNRAPTAPPSPGARFDNPENGTAPPAPPPSVTEGGEGARFRGVDDHTLDPEHANRDPDTPEGGSWLF